MDTLILVVEICQLELANKNARIKSSSLEILLEKFVSFNIMTVDLVFNNSNNLRRSKWRFLYIALTV